MAIYKLPSVEDLFAAGVHLGHPTRRWHPKMEPYIYGVKRGLHIMDLGDTLKNLEKACDFFFDIASSGGKIMFVGTKKQAQALTKDHALNSGVYYVNERWLGGTFTNLQIIRKNVARYLDLSLKKEKGELSHYTKKERLLIDRELEKLERSVGGIVGLDALPAAIFVVDPKREKTAVKEARKVGVKVVGLVDSNTDPTDLDMLIPGNDDALKALDLILGTVSGALVSGYKEFEKKSQAAKGTEDAATVPAKKPKASPKQPSKVTAS